MHFGAKLDILSTYKKGVKPWEYLKKRQAVQIRNAFPLVK